MAFTTPTVPPGNLVYARPSDIVTANFTWTAAAGTVSTDANYGLPALYDGRMSRPLKFTDDPAVAVRVVGDAGSATRVDGMALPNSNLPAGTILKAQLGSDPTFATFAVSVDVLVGAAGLDGHVASPWASFVTASGYTTAGYRYASLYVPAVSVSPQLGELLVLSHLREFTVWPQFGARGQAVPFLENLYTEYGVRRVIKRLIRQRRVTYQFRGTDTDFDALQALVQDCGGVATPFFLAANSTVKSDGGLYGRLTPDTAALIEGAEEWFDLTNFTVAFEEDSRSLPL